MGKKFKITKFEVGVLIGVAVLVVCIIIGVCKMVSLSMKADRAEAVIENVANNITNTDVQEVSRKAGRTWGNIKKGFSEGAAEVEETNNEED